LAALVTHRAVAPLAAGPGLGEPDDVPAALDVEEVVGWGDEPL
jgi:hypothetical protein